MSVLPPSWRAAPGLSADGRGPLLPGGRPDKGDGTRLVSSWWLHPGAAVVALVVPTLLVALLTSPETYREAWRTPKWVSMDTVALVGPALAALVLGCVAGGCLVRRGRPGTAPWPTLSPGTEATLRRAFPILIRITFAAYALWGLALLARGITPWGLVDMARSGQIYDSALRDRLRGISGVTTLTQVGVAAVIVGAVLDARQRSRAIRRSLLILLAIAAARSYFLAERLAIIELAVPWLVVRGAVAAGSPSRHRRRLVQFAPLLAVPLLFAVFAGFELSRSWSYFSSTSQQSYSSFAVSRLLGYYTTSYNNGQVLYDHYRWDAQLPYYSVEFFWSFPAVQSVVPYERVTAPTPPADRPRYEDVLARYANPEFNSPNGLVAPAVDFGPVGGIAFLAVAGVAAGAAYQSFRRSRTIGMLLYPAIFTGLLELPRELYWTLGRNLPVWVALVAVLWAVGRQARDRARSGARAPETADTDAVGPSTGRALVPSGAGGTPSLWRPR